MPPSPGVRFSRCCAYQGSFRKSSKSVVNSLSISAKVPVFQGFAEIIKVVFKTVVFFPCCGIMILPHKLILPKRRECVFTLVKMHSPFWHSLRLSEVCVATNGVVRFSVRGSV